MSPYRSELSLANRLLRLVWGLVWRVCFRGSSPRPCFFWLQDVAAAL